MYCHYIVYRESISIIGLASDIYFKTSHISTAYYYHVSCIPGIIIYLGVTDVKCDLETKKVDVTHDDSVDKQVIVDSLSKWSESSGKSVQLAECCQ